MVLRLRRQVQGTRLNALAVAVALLAAGSAFASEIDLGNPDFKFRWDNTIRYNLGMRVGEPDSRILANPSYDEGDSKFKRGQIVTDRLDVLSELDLAYKGKYGGRMSLAGWYDNAYENRTVHSPAEGGTFATSYYNNSYNNIVSRYENGPSGEVLDGFVWGNFLAGAIPVNVKLGRHTVVWGEGLLIGAHAISYSQAPQDGAKALSSPGIETKEVFLPLNQLSFKAQLTNDLSLAGQYFLEWEPTRAPYGGTYLMGADTAPQSDRVALAPGINMSRVDALVPKNAGNRGLALRWDAEPIESTLGLYFRRFNDYTPETGIQLRSFTELVPGNAATTVPTTYRFVYAKNVEIIGASFSRLIGPVSFGSEVSLRKNGHLNSATSYLPDQDTGARGDTLHVVMNGLYLLPKTPLWDTGNLLVEVAFEHLQRITSNANLYRAEGYASCVKAGTGGGGVPAQPGDRTDACSTKNFLQVAANFAPQWLSVLPSWDLTAPMSINYGVKGTAPSGGAGFEHLLTWSVGATMVYQAKHEFSLRFSDISVPTKYNATGTTLIGGNALGSSIGATDRAWLVFTYKTSF